LLSAREPRRADQGGLSLLPPPERLEDDRTRMPMTACPLPCRCDCIGLRLHLVTSVAHHL